MTVDTPCGTCATVQARCVCILPSGHETPHVCECGGSFVRRGDELFVYAFPQYPAMGLDQDEAVQRANELVRSGVVYTEPVEPVMPYTVNRGPITYFREKD